MAGGTGDRDLIPTSGNRAPRVSTSSRPRAQPSPAGPAQSALCGRLRVWPHPPAYDAARPLDDTPAARGEMVGCAGYAPRLSLLGRVSTEWSAAARIGSSARGRPKKESTPGRTSPATGAGHVRDLRQSHDAALPPASWSADTRLHVPGRGHSNRSAGVPACARRSDRSSHQRIVDGRDEPTRARGRTRGSSGASRVGPLRRSPCRRLYGRGNFA